MEAFDLGSFQALSFSLEDLFDKDMDGNCYYYFL